METYLTFHPEAPNDRQARSAIHSAEDEVLVQKTLIKIDTKPKRKYVMWKHIRNLFGRCLAKSVLMVCVL